MDSFSKEGQKRMKKVLERSKASQQSTYTKGVNQSVKPKNSIKVSPKTVRVQGSKNKEYAQAKQVKIGDKNVKFERASGSCPPGYKLNRASGICEFQI